MEIKDIDKIDNYIKKGLVLDSDLVVKLLCQPKLKDSFSFAELLEPDEKIFQHMFNSQKTYHDAYFYFYSKSFLQANKLIVNIIIR